MSSFRSFYSLFLSSTLFCSLVLFFLYLSLPFARIILSFSLLFTCSLSLSYSLSLARFILSFSVLLSSVHQFYSFSLFLSSFRPFYSFFFSPSLFLSPVLFSLHFFRFILSLYLSSFRPFYSFFLSSFCQFYSFAPFLPSFRSFCSFFLFLSLFRSPILLFFSLFCRFYFFYLFLSSIREFCSYFLFLTSVRPFYFFLPLLLFLLQNIYRIHCMKFAILRKIRKKYEWTNSKCLGLLCDFFVNIQSFCTFPDSHALIF